MIENNNIMTKKLISIIPLPKDIINIINDLSFDTESYDKVMRELDLLYNQRRIFEIFDQNMLSLNEIIKKVKELGTCHRCNMVKHISISTTMKGHCKYCLFIIFGELTITQCACNRKTKETIFKHQSCY